MSGKIARIILFMAPALALAACGQSNEEELTRQLAEAKATAAQESAAREAAEREAASLRARERNSPDLQGFYAGSGGDDDSTTAEDHQPGDTPNDQPMDAAPQASAPEAAPPPPAPVQAGA